MPRPPNKFNGSGHLSKPWIMKPGLGYFSLFVELAGFLLVGLESLWAATDLKGFALRKWAKIHGCPVRILVLTD